MGARHQPSYRIVVADSRTPRDGRFNEIIGFYNPLPDPPVVQIDAERAAYWITRGARPSEAVARFLQRPKATKEEPPKNGEGG